MEQTEATYHHALSYSTSNCATLGDEPAVCYPEETSINGRVDFRDVENTAASCSAVRSVLNNGLHNKTPYIPLTRPVVQQHNIENWPLDRNTITQPRRPQAVAHDSEYGGAAVDISLPPGLDYEYTRAYNGMTPLQRFIETPSNRSFRNASVEQQAHDFDIELDNVKSAYHTVEQREGCHQVLISGVRTTYLIERPETYVNSFLLTGESAQDLAAWGNDLAGVGAQFSDDLGSRQPVAE